MSVARVGARVLGLLGVLAVVVATAPVLLVGDARMRTGWLRGVAWLVLAATGVRVRVHGPRRFAEGAALVVANHMSWIEVLALISVQPVWLVAKREVRDWPVIGAVAAVTGTLFIDRRGLHSLPAAIADVAAALRSGVPVVVFPEGTTWCGLAAGPFRPAPFQAALDAGVPIRPVGIALRRAGRAAPEAAFIGGQGLLSSVLVVLGLSRLVCELTVLPAIAGGSDRAGLARSAAAAVSAATGVAHPARPRRVPAGVPAGVTANASC